MCDICPAPSPSFSLAAPPPHHHPHGHALAAAGDETMIGKIAGLASSQAVDRSSLQAEVCDQKALLSAIMLGRLVRFLATALSTYPLIPPPPSPISRPPFLPIR